MRRWWWRQKCTSCAHIKASVATTASSAQTAAPMARAAADSGENWRLGGECMHLWHDGDEAEVAREEEEADECVERLHAL